MKYVFLVIVVLGVCVQNIFKKQFNTKAETKTDKNACLKYSFMVVLTAAIFLGIIYIFKFSFCLESLGYATLFAICYSATSFSSFMSIKEGSLSLSALIISFSTMLPVLFGIGFLDEKLTLVGGTGLLFLSLSLVFISKVKKEEKINIKWLIYLAVSFLGNGFCSIIQKVHQINVVGDYSICFQFIAMVISTMLFAIILAVRKSGSILVFSKKYGKYTVLTGIANAIVNVLMLYLAVNMDSVILYPIVSAGGILLTFITALTLYKEKLNKVQYIGYLFGIVSIILLGL